MDDDCGRRLRISNFPRPTRHQREESTVGGSFEQNGRAPRMPRREINVLLARYARDRSARQRLPRSLLKEGDRQRQDGAAKVRRRRLAQFFGERLLVEYGARPACVTSMSLSAKSATGRHFQEGRTKVHAASDSGGRIVRDRRLHLSIGPRLTCLHRCRRPTYALTYRRRFMRSEASMSQARRDVSSRIRGSATIRPRGTKGALPTIESLALACRRHSGGYHR